MRLATRLLECWVLFVHPSARSKVTRTSHTTSARSRMATEWWHLGVRGCAPTPKHRVAGGPGVRRRISGHNRRALWLTVNMTLAGKLASIDTLIDAPVTP